MHPVSAMQPNVRITRLLVGIDDSQEARAAQRHALHIARRMNAEMILAHACPRPEISPRSHSSPAVFRQIVLPELMASAGPRELDPGASGAGHEDLTISKLFIDGAPDPGIADAAWEAQADLVVIGTHGRSGLRRALLGSVAERTVRRAGTAVLVARGAAPERQGYGRVLVPTDFSAVAQRALQLALALTAPSGVVELVHCWSVPARAVTLPMHAGAPAAVPAAASSGVPAAPVVPMRDDAREIAMAEGRRLVALHRHDSIEITFDLVDGRPAPTILERLRRGGYDLCVMGSHDRRGLRRLLLGSVAEHTVRHAPCSVLVSRRPRDRRDER